MKIQAVKIVKIIKDSEISRTLLCIPLSILFEGNLLTCDCQLSYLHHYLTSAPRLSSSSLLSAVCATPPSLGNAPLAQLAGSELSCDPEQEYYYRYCHTVTGNILRKIKKIFDFGDKNRK